MVYLEHTVELRLFFAAIALLLVMLERLAPDLLPLCNFYTRVEVDIANIGNKLCHQYDNH